MSKKIKISRRFLRGLVLAVAGVIAFAFGFVALYFAAAWGLSRIAIPAEKDGAKEVAIFIKTNGAHTDIVMPVRNEIMDWSRALPCRNNISQDTTYSYVAIGWGDKGFFLDMPTWNDLTPQLAFRAAFWLSSTAMHATYYKEVAGGTANSQEANMSSGGEVLREGPDCRRILVSRRQYARLVDFVEGRFRRGPDGCFINIKTGAAYGLTDAFYEAHGRYNLFYTCNTWANDALAAAGQRHCLWTVFDKGIFLISRQATQRSSRGF